MKIVLENNEAMEIFHSSLCNGLGYIRGYDLSLDYDKEEYQQAKAKLEAPCYEDVLVQVLKDGGTLSLVDEESEDVYQIDESKVYERMVDVGYGTLNRIIEENDDAIDADVVLQTIFLKEVVFG